MSSISRVCAVRFIIVTFALLLSGCGGGAGGGKSDAPVDPSTAYKGSLTQAQVSQDNAEALALGGFKGSMINSTVRIYRTAGDSAVTQDEPSDLLRSLTGEIKNSLRSIDVPRVAQQIRDTRRVSGSAKSLGRILSNQISGRNGGFATYDIDINDATGSFAGTITYHGFKDLQTTIDGSADIRGTFDANYQAISRITISFTKLSLSYGTARITLIGSLSWAYNLSASSETLNINTVLIDLSNGKTYWFNNYTVSTSYGSSSLTQTLSGRFYDPDHGYVDFSSQMPLVASYGSSWPSQGGVKYSGRSKTWSLLSFHPRNLTIDADTTGSGTASWQKVRPTNSQQDYNTPPVADAGPDQNVAQMTSVILNGSASNDPDGDPLSYSWSFNSCPQGSCPAISGANTATPSFVANKVGTYTLSLTVNDGLAASPADSMSVNVAPASPSSPKLLQQQWQYGVFGSSIGKAGLLLSDLDGDGTPEIIASASGGGFGDNTFWYILKRSAGGTYEQIWRSEVYPVTVVRLALADCNGDGQDEVVVALADGTIHVYDRITRQALRTLTVSSPLTDMAIADLDGDGAMEIITSNGTAVFVYAASTGGLKWSLPNGGGNSIAVGNVDTDSALEIVTTTYGGKGYVIDGISHAIEWEYINSFGAQVRLADLDGDGMQEIIGASSWYKITVFDADRLTPAWEITTTLDIGALLVADTDGDGIPEIIYGDGQWGKLHAIDARSHTERWSVNNPEHGVSGIALGDVDLDGKKELLWGAGGTSSGADYLYVAAPDTGTIKWQSQDVFGMNAVAVGDLDGDGIDELLMVTQSSNSGYDEGVVFIYDARTHALKFSQKLGIRDWMGTARTVRIGDVDGDGKNEYVVTTADLYDGVVQVYDGSTHTLKCQSAGYNGNYFSALAIGDVDNDGKVEIVAGQGREHTGAAGVYLVVFDGATLQEKWRSTDLGVYWGSVYDIKLADLDGDGHQEIIATVADNQLLVYDGLTHDLKRIITHPSRTVEIADIDGDGNLEVLVGRNDGLIDVFDGKTFTVKQSVDSYASAAVDALRLADLNGDGVAEWLIGTAGTMTVLDGQNQRLKWRSANLASNLGYRNHIAVKDVDGDGRKDIFIGSSLGLFHYE